MSDPTTDPLSGLSSWLRQWYSLTCEVSQESCKIEINAVDFVLYLSVWFERPEYEPADNQIDRHQEDKNYQGKMVHR